MKQPFINILIRHTANREALFQKCINSIRNQTFLNYRIIVLYDYNEPHFLLPDDVFEFYKETNYSLGKFHYNDYCNDLKKQVNGGWFFFLDDDDYLKHEFALEVLAENLTNNCDAVICQMSRDNGTIKPSDTLIDYKRIESGRIGLPCLVLRSIYKDCANIATTEDGDYRWIKKVTENPEIRTKFVKHVVVHSPQRNFGR